MRIAVDVMGGDHAPEAVLQGALKAHSELALETTLVGPPDVIRSFFSTGIPANIHIHPASQVISNSDKPAQALREKKDSSLAQTIRLLKEKQVDAAISAGNSGAQLAISLFDLGRLEGISRPAIAATLPTLTGKVILIDAGANTDCKPNNLVEFALMGKIYAKEMLEIDNPRVALISNGHEESKGNELVQQSYPLLREKEKNFIGNLEGRDILSGQADVLVCDGFTGNLILKFAEGLAFSIYDFIKTDIKKHPTHLIGLLLIRGILKSFKQKIDWREHGGAPLLGVDGAVIFAHGASDAYAVASGIRTAYTLHQKNILQKIKEKINGTSKSHQ